jgi:hypothetical protein
MNPYRENAFIESKSFPSSKKWRRWRSVIQLFCRHSFKRKHTSNLVDGCLYINFYCRCSKCGKKQYEWYLSDSVPDNYPQPNEFI